MKKKKKKIIGKSTKAARGKIERKKKSSKKAISSKKKLAAKKNASLKKATRGKILAKILKKLEEERAYLQEKIASAKRDEWMGSVNDEIDTAVASAERDILFERVDRFVQRLDEIENALRKAKKRKFGICEKCGGEISIRRLKLIPYARYCFKCMAK